MKKFQAFKLTRKEMRNVLGGSGTTAEEYCDTLVTTAQNNEFTASGAQAAAESFMQHCEPLGYRMFGFRLKDGETNILPD